jgi:GT2 family glycosyltransferase
VTVSAVVVSHGHALELERLLPALAPQVDELVVVANVPGSVGPVPAGTRVLVPPRPRSFAANVNAGIEATTGTYVLGVNPDAIPDPGAVEALAAFADSRPRCGIAGPQLLWPDGTWQPSRRRFPTVGGTLVRRTPLRLLRPPYERQREHYHLDERPQEPVPADWLLGAFLLQRRTMLDELGGWDAGYRHYVEDIDLCYRAARAGWERWYVPQAIARHAYAAVIDRRFLSRHTLWHARGMARFVRKHPGFLGARAGIRKDADPSPREDP